MKLKALAACYRTLILKVQSDLAGWPRQALWMTKIFRVPPFGSLSQVPHSIHRLD